MQPLPEGFCQGMGVFGDCLVSPCCRDWFFRECGHEWGVEFAQTTELTPDQARRGKVAIEPEPARGGAGDASRQTGPT